MKVQWIFFYPFSVHTAREMKFCLMWPENISVLYLTIIYTHTIPGIMILINLPFINKWWRLLSKYICYNSFLKVNTTLPVPLPFSICVASEWFWNCYMALPVPAGFVEWMETGFNYPCGLERPCFSCYCCFLTIHSTGNSRSYNHLQIPWKCFTSSFRENRCGDGGGRGGEVDGEEKKCPRSS